MQTARRWLGGSGETTGESIHAAVELTDEQIDFLRQSLRYSDLRFSEDDCRPMDMAWMAKRRREKEEMITSICKALAEARASVGVKPSRCWGSSLGG
jgi:hypothetical protein